MMDASVEPGIHTVVLMTSAQIGKTEIINNVLGYFLTHDPCPILAMHPTVEMAQTWSKDRLTPMIRDTPSLRDIFNDTRTGDLSNTILHKKFPGGHLTGVGANSPVGLASRPIRIVLPDEVDRFPHEVGNEGDPLSLAIKRTTTFYNRLIFMASTPTTKDKSRIETSFLESDQRYFFVPCPECGIFQVLKWARVMWDGTDASSATYCCELCEKKIPHTKKAGMVADGEWRATSESDGIAGFAINEVYSPWVTWAEMASEYMKVKDNPVRYKTFVNTSLGETYEDVVESVDDSMLLQRCEPYVDPPPGVELITAGVDVHKSNIKVEIVGWGADYESWSLDYETIYGDTAKPKIWSDLTKFLNRTFGKMAIRATAIDSRYRTDSVFEFVKRRQRTFAIKGVPGWGKPTIAAPKDKSKSTGVRLYSVGSSDVKRMMHDRLRVQEHGPGFCHFPIGYEEDFFLELTSEVIVQKQLHGYAADMWEKKPGTQNHFGDCRVYATAALAICGTDLDRVIEVCRAEKRAVVSHTPAGGSFLGPRSGGKWVS